MSAPKGNKNAQGNCGGGRKSAFEENRDAEWISRVWSEETDINALASKIETKRFSIRDMLLYKALNGDTAALKSLADKMLPDKHNLATQEKPIPILFGLAK